MDNHLSRDEFEALEQVSQAKSFDKPSACVARNGKRLVGIKMLSYRKNGTYELTEKGAEALLLFLAKLAARLCIGVVIAMFFIALADLIYQRFHHIKSLRMTKQELANMNPE